MRRNNMSVSLHEVLQDGGELRWWNDIDDAKWILNRKHEFEEIIAEAEETLELYDDYLAYAEELEGLGEYGKILSFEEYKRLYDEGILEEKLNEN